MTITWHLRLRKVTRGIMRTAFVAGAWVWGIRIRTQGTLAEARPLMIVSNHFSYLDMFVLGSQVPAAFTPKREIRSWPVIGFMCKVSGCLFIDRRPASILANKTTLDKSVSDGDIISLFPEGTTNEGTALLPFKSSLFSIALERGMAVQPVSVAYTRLNGKPIDAATRPVVGWYGDALFFPHVITFLKQKHVDAEIVYHPPVRANDFASRKELALYCHDVIEKALLQT
jgi:1-acyl-sn-glycerol-3-phosphate acyltransferase